MAGQAFLAMEPDAWFLSTLFFLLPTEPQPFSVRGSIFGPVRALGLSFEIREPLRQRGA